MKRKNTTIENKLLVWAGYVHALNLHNLNPSKKEQTRLSKFMLQYVTYCLENGLDHKTEIARIKAQVSKWTIN